MAEVHIDFTEKIGKMKPMHSLNHGPLTENLRYDARHLFKQAGIPYTRLHDVEYPYGSGEYVDIPCIFKNFDADTEDQGSYNFDLTDDYLAAITEVGTKPLYRLGVSIEHPERKRYIYPPKDYLKWAKICEHIILHYNYGWANGFHMDIEYWEIWTEPNHCNSENPLMWGSDMNEFARFYDVAATYLKKKFPELKIGGPAFSSPATEPVHIFFDTFEKMEKHPPLDFFSWHGYVDSVEKARQRAHDAEAILKQYGYEKAESIYDEWNYVKDWSNMLENTAVIHSHKGMAFDAAMMAAMQSEHCDMMNFYAVSQKFAVWNSLFEHDTTVNNRNGGVRMMRKKKAFEAFIAFGNLYRLNTQTLLKTDDEHIYGVAAGNGEKNGFMISSFAPLDEELQEKEVHFSLNGTNGRKLSVFITDETRNADKLFSFCGNEFDLTVPPYSMIYAETE